MVSVKDAANGFAYCVALLSHALRLLDLASLMGMDGTRQMQKSFSINYTKSYSVARVSRLRDSAKDA